MADGTSTNASTGRPLTGGPHPPIPSPPRTLDEARTLAKRRFKERLQRGEKVGGCSCHTDDEAALGDDGSDTPTAHVAGVRFRDSGRTYYFDPGQQRLDVGDWVVVETSRGREAGRVIIAPHQVRLNLLQGELKPVLRRLGEQDVRRMDELKRQAASAVKTFGAKIRERHLPMKPISAEYNFDGSQLLLNFSAPERVDFRELARDLSATFHCRVELHQVGPRDEARLLGGLGRCGRTLCCASWLPVYPEISMNMAKTQDLPLNPSKVSGVCGRLLCCLSYENEQYKQMKAIMPRLGQTIETPAGPGLVVSLQLMKELITVRLEADTSEVVFSSSDLGLREPEPVPAPPAPRITPVSSVADEAADVEGDPPELAAAAPDDHGHRRRRRRRGGGKRGG